MTKMNTDYQFINGIFICIMAILRLQGETEKKKGLYYEVDTSEPAIGEGGMGKVMKGTCVDVNTKVTRPVAIKFLYDDLPSHAIERARREASIQLRNDNLIEMLGFIEVETGTGANVHKHYHVVSELLHGLSLADLLDGKCADKSGKEIPFAKKLLKEHELDTVRFAKTIVKSVLSGLVALHDAGYVHRDIDPSNIMITDDGHIKLIDFGIAKQVNKLTTNDRSLTTAGSFMGKAEYAAPELALGDLKHQDQTTDIYAMGILLYQCIVGHVPFEGPSHIVLEKQIKKSIPLSLVKDKGIRKVIQCATDKDQSVRFQTASQMRVAMENLDGQRMQMKKSKKITIIVVFISLFLLVTAFIGVSYHKKNVEKRRLELLESAANDSLRTDMETLAKNAEKKLKIGDQHGEGYEQAYIDAYIGYKEAIETARKITKGKKNTSYIIQGKEKALKALLSAKAELDAKADEFAAEDNMEDVVQEFQNRSKRISETIK